MFFFYGVLSSILLDQAGSQIGQQIKTFCKNDNVELMEATIHYHRVIVLRIRTQIFNLKISINSINYQLGVRRQKTNNISPFGAQFARKLNTPLININTEPYPKKLAVDQFWKNI